MVTALFAVVVVGGADVVAAPEAAVVVVVAAAVDTADAVDAAVDVATRVVVVDVCD